MRFAPLDDTTALSAATALRRVYAAHRLHVVRIRSAFIFAVPLHTCKPQCETAWIARALLQVTEGDLHDELRPDIHSPLIAVRLASQKFPGLPFQECVRQPLECLSQHDIFAGSWIQ